MAQSTPKGYYKYAYGRTDAQGQPVIEQLSKDNNTAYIEHDPVTGEPLMLRTSTGMQSLYITDGTGNPTALLASGNYVTTAYSYDPYGVATITKDAGGNATDQNPYTFKNGVQDRTTGWIKYGARYYQPTTGRWTQQDTLDNPLNPNNANRYAYAANNPLNNADPTGLDAIGCSVAQGLLVIFAIGFFASAPVDGPVGILAGIAIVTSLAGGVGAGSDYVEQCS